MLKVDLHTHSIASHDGGITPLQYQKALTTGLLDFIAVTDHNTIDLALAIHQQLGSQIIVGEEIMTTQGEIIGLFLNKLVKSGQSPAATVNDIHAQGGLVYIPHPFETIRHGLHPAAMEELAGQIDIVEVANGRAFAQNRGKQAVLWAKLNHLPGAASSDAHGLKGLGRSYTHINQEPDVKNLVKLVASGTAIAGRPTARALLYPKYNKLKKRVGL